MNAYGELGIRRQLVGITILFFLAFIFLVVDSEDEVRERYGNEKQRVERLLEDTTQVINALEYSITALHPLQNERYVLPHIIQLNGITCNFGGQSHQGQDYDFMFSGPAEMCDTNSELYALAYKRMFVAPSMAYFAKTISHISAIYFISKDKFIISTPKAFAESIEGDAFDAVISTRPYWVNTMQRLQDDKVVYTGDYQDHMTGRRVITLTRAIYVDGEFRGVLAIDSYLDDLVADRHSSYRLTSELKENNPEAFDFTCSNPVMVNNQETGLYLTVKESKQTHLKLIFQAEQKQFIGLFWGYMLCLCLIWFRDTRSTQTRLRSLAMRDPMTNMLNRRGFEFYLKDIELQGFIALAVFDIDDFKAINDSLGHEAGDEVICAISSLLSRSLRQSDLMARFGGEEFVIAITGESYLQIQSVVERVQREISTTIHLSDGQYVSVTATGGASVYSCDNIENLECLWQEKGIRQADVLLYQAKVAGKNRVLVGVGC